MNVAPARQAAAKRPIQTDKSRLDRCSADECRASRSVAAEVPFGANAAIGRITRELVVVEAFLDELLLHGAARWVEA
jgi:hypothetical protein